MVRSTLRNRGGRLPIKFLVTVAIIAGVAYYGIGAIRGYVKFYQMRDEMRVQARFAGNQTDVDIRRKLRAKATELGLPPDAQRITIRRQGRPRMVIITASWPDTIAVPFYGIPITYRPEARAPL
jgi:hypothetical protein